MLRQSQLRHHTSALALLTEGNAEENTYIAVLGEQSFVQEFII